MTFNDFSFSCSQLELFKRFHTLNDRRGFLDRREEAVVQYGGRGPETQSLVYKPGTCSTKMSCDTHLECYQPTEWALSAVITAVRTLQTGQTAAAML